MARPFLCRVVCGLVLSRLITTTSRSQPVEAQDVSFEVPDVSAGRLALRGKLWQAASPATAAVVIVHGSAGYSVHREGHYAQAFAAAGFDVLAIDSFGPRGISTTSEDQSQVSTTQMTRDVFAATDPGVLNAMRSTCVRKGGSMWTNVRQKERATLDAVAFVKSVFADATR